MSFAFFFLFSLQVSDELAQQDFSTVPNCTVRELRVTFSSQEQLWYDEVYKSTRKFLLSLKRSNGALSLTGSVMSRLTELRQSCDHPQLVSRQHRLLGMKSMSQNRLSLQAIIAKLLKKSMLAEGVKGKEARVNFLKLKGEQYGLNLNTEQDDKEHINTTGADEQEQDMEMLTCSICLDQPEIMAMAKCGTRTTVVCY